MISGVSDGLAFLTNKDNSRVAVVDGATHALKGVTDHHLRETTKLQIYTWEEIGVLYNTKYYFVMGAGQSGSFHAMDYEEANQQMLNLKGISLPQ